MESDRIDPDEARADIMTRDALLVCAYDTREKFLANRIEGALSLDQLQAIEDALPVNREIIFYCA